MVSLILTILDFVRNRVSMFNNSLLSSLLKWSPLSPVHIGLWLVIKNVSNFLLDVSIPLLKELKCLDVFINLLKSSESKDDS